MLLSKNTAWSNKFYPIKNYKDTAFTPLFLPSYPSLHLHPAPVLQEHHFFRGELPAAWGPAFMTKPCSLASEVHHFKNVNVLVNLNKTWTNQPTHLKNPCRKLPIQVFT